MKLLDQAVRHLSSLGSGNLQRQRMLRRQDDVRHTHQRVRPCGENLDFLTRTLKLEGYTAVPMPYVPCAREGHDMRVAERDGTGPNFSKKDQIRILYLFCIRLTVPSFRLHLEYVALGRHPIPVSRCRGFA